MSGRKSTAIERVCQHCGNLFFVCRARLKERSAIFCSLVCRVLSNRRSIEDVFWENIGRKTETGCIIYGGFIHPQGYGYIRQHFKAHRVSYELMVAPIPPGLCVLHRCDNRACINPMHLFLGNNRDNNLDRDNKNRQAKGKAIWTNKLTEQQVKEIRSAYSGGDISSRKLGELYSVSHHSILAIVNRRVWKQIN